MLRPVRAQARRAKLRIHPLRPPLEPPARIASLSRTSDDLSFITGNGLAARCRYVLNYDVLSVNEGVDNNWWFCKRDFLDYFFAQLAPRENFVLFSHNSDYPVDARFRRRLEQRQLVAWFGANVALRHPKLFAFPLGIANPRWPHGDGGALHRAQDASAQRTTLFNVSFDLSTNSEERHHCLEQTGLERGPKKPFPEYLDDLRSSYFCISPRGNGIDTHRTWEALYLGTIPVVTRSVLTEQHPDLPMVVLDDWSQFGSIDFSPELYEELIAGWEPAVLALDRYLERVTGTIDRLRAWEPTE